MNDKIKGSLAPGGSSGSLAPSPFGEGRGGASGGASLPKVGRYHSRVEPFHCDLQNRLFPGHLGNGMLNAADYHAADRGYGVAELNQGHHTWVLSRFAIEIEDMPKAYDQVAAETWVESVKKFFTSRNFAMTRPDDGHVYAYGRSIWAMIDTQTRQPANILAIRDGVIEQYVETDKPCPIAPPSRVMVPAEAPLVRQIGIYYSDVDINGHLNSVKYIDHVLDLFTLDLYRTHHLRRIDIAYVAEAHAGDTLYIYMAETAEGEYAVKMTKKVGGENGEENSGKEGENEVKEVEVVRCKVNFVKD